MQAKPTVNFCKLTFGAISVLACTEADHQKKVEVPTPERVSAQVPYKIGENSINQVVIAGGPHQTAHLPFDWSIYSDPSRPEFWADGDHRLHDRFRWRRNAPDGAWEITRLNP